jgi:hypothetical protein
MEADGASILYHWVRYGALRTNATPLTAQRSFLGVASSEKNVR